MELIVEIFHPRKFYHSLKILNIGKISLSRVLFRQQSIISHGNQGGSGSRP